MAWYAIASRVLHTWNSAKKQRASEKLTFIINGNIQTNLSNDLFEIQTCGKMKEEEMSLIPLSCFLI